MIAGADPVDDARVIEERHRLVGARPLHRLVGVVHDVAVVRDKADVECRALVDDPRGLRGEDRGKAARVVLGVGQADHGERRIAEPAVLRVGAHEVGRARDDGELGHPAALAVGLDAVDPVMGQRGRGRKKKRCSQDCERWASDHGHRLRDARTRAFGFV